MTLAALILALIATPLADEGGPAPPPTSPAASRGEPTLLDFHTNWCGPCKKMRPGLAQLAAAGFPIRSIDADKEVDLAARYKVTAYPTFIVVDDGGEVLARTEGYQPADDLATLYREAQAKVRSRPRPRQVTHRDDVEEQAEPESEGAVGRRIVNPKPWETVVRIRVRLSQGSEGVGSGTVIYSDAKQSIILTCAHIFKEEGRTPPPPSQFRLPIAVDLFDGQPGGPKRNQVHQTETVKGEAIDYDPLNDVGLIRIRPGKVLPMTRVVPPRWKPAEGMHMITVGCSEGRDATAWDTKILRAKAGLMVQGTGKTFQMIECDFAPKQGRSGGGLYTDDHYLAGVCDFADPKNGTGLYAVPQSIYKILDRNTLTALYDPTTRDVGGSQSLLASNAPRSNRQASPGGVYRGQSPSEEDVTIPPPKFLGIEDPVVAKADPSRRGAAISDPAWRPPASRPARSQAVPARLSREGEDIEPAPAPAAGPTEGDNPEDVPASSLSGGKSKWRPVRRPVEGI